MQTFRILYLRESVLRRAETIDARDLLDVIDKAASERPPQDTAEIWSDMGKVGIVAPSPRQAGGPSGAAGEEEAEAPGAEIAEEMKERLKLAQG
jgi:hypothetical protein